MYPFLLGHDEELAFRMDRERLLMPVFVDRDQPVVVRIESKGALRQGEFGVEYGGFAVIDRGELKLETRAWFNQEGNPCCFPLRFGDDGQLYSMPLPPSEEHWLNVNGSRPQGVNWEHIPAQPARPSRPIGYVLDASHARKKIVRAASNGSRAIS